VKADTAADPATITARFLDVTGEELYQVAVTAPELTP
jgi:hypothetical protein